MLENEFPDRVNRILTGKPHIYIIICIKDDDHNSNKTQMPTIPPGP